jgi:vancomycin aglycone glucosyltransferase
MRVLLSTIGSRGDVQPLVALASQLSALGHDARLCVPPDFAEWIGGLGMPVTTIGPELRKLTGGRPPSTQPAFSPEQRRQLAQGTVAEQFNTLTAAAEGCTVVVAATALQIAARSVAERMGIPYVFAAYCPIVLPSTHHAPPPLPPLTIEAPASDTSDNHTLWARDGERFNDLFGAALNSRRAPLGLPPVDDVRSHIFSDRPWLAADPTLAPWPAASKPGDDISVFQPGAWILPDERPLGHEVETFLDAAEPPVYFGFGSIRAPQNLSEVMITTARALGRRAIVSRGWAGLTLIDSAPDCLSIGEINQQALFRRVAAVVHHGGAGTTTAAALAGAPQVVIPQIYDQHYWARRVQELGIGIAHAPGTPTIDSLTAALEHALRPDVTLRAKSVAAAVRRDGARTAVERLSADYGR